MGGNEHIEPAPSEFPRPSEISPLPSAADREPGRNGRAFIQDNLWTEGRVQYAVWVEPDGGSVVGMRRLPSGGWSTFDLGQIDGNPLRLPTVEDLHNVYAIAVDEAGYIHIAGNMHNDSLRYIRSTRPGDITSWSSEPMIGRNESSATYPTFVRRKDGTLLFFYRQGSAGEGDTYLNAWLADDERWYRVARLIAGRASGHSAYLQHVAVDHTGTIHIMYTWRSSGPETTSDLSYASSSDGGVTWTASDGQTLSLPLTVQSSEIALDTEARGSGLSNAGGLETDEEGAPHAAVLLEGSVQHIWHDGGQWSSEEVAVPSAVTGRPSIATTREGEVYVLIATRSDEGSIVWLREVSSEEGARGEIPLRALPVDDWEPTFDTRALYGDGILRMMLPSDGDTGNAAEVVGFELEAIEEGQE